MGLRSSDQLWSRGQWIRRLRLLVAVLAGACAIAAVVTSATDKLPSQLRVGGPLAAVLALVAVLAPQLEQRLKQAQDALTTKDRQLDRDIRRLAQRSRLDLLAQVRRYWIETELEVSLQKLTRIELGLAERPGAVDYALRALLRRPDERDCHLERDKPISDIYRQLGRQLLILGGPGAGKTTLLLQLTQQLLEQAEADSAEPMPVVFQLSTWALERPTLATWLIDELRKRYGVSRALGEFWLKSEQIIPLLDGLDEVALEHQGAFIAAINDFHNAHGLLPLVVCSRVAEYEALQAKLQLRGAIVIQPLTGVEVERYLRQAGRPLAGVRAVLRDDEQLGELLITPLFLSIVTLAYQGKPAAAVRASGSLEERRRRVLADYVEAMFSRPRGIGTSERYSPDQTRAWLTWLAQAMRAHDQTLFYLDWMQPNWLPTRAQQRLVTRGVTVGIGLVVGLVVGLVYGLFYGLVSEKLGFGWGLGMIFFGIFDGLVYGLVSGFAASGRGITPIEQSRWSRAAMRRGLPRRLIAGLVVGLVVGLIGGLINAVAAAAGPAGPLVGLLVGLVFGLVAGLIAILVSGRDIRLQLTPAAPGEGMKTSKRTALVSGLTSSLSVWLGFGLAAVLLLERALGPVRGLVAGLAFGLQVAPAVGLVVALRRGGASYLRHLALRWLLTRHQLAPWGYVAFLEYATGLILLRRRGGGYEFIHRLLLEYFASVEATVPAVHQSVSPSASSADAGQQLAE